MKLGFYVETSGGTPQNTEIYNFLNKEVAEQNLDDAAVFFNTTNFNPIVPKFGMFDATELWHFTGNLITTSVVNTIKARNVVNKFNIAYLFKSEDKGEQTVFELARIAKEMKVLVTNETDEKEFYRLTGVKPKKINGLSLKEISEVFDD